MSAKGIDYYLIGNNTTILRKSTFGKNTLNACPPGYHSHIDYQGGKCHRINQLHVAENKMRQNMAGGDDNVKVAMFIRNQLMKISQIMKNDPGLKQCFIYINEVIRKPHDVQTWGKFYMMLQMTVEKNQKLPALVQLYQITRSVKV